MLYNQKHSTTKPNNKCCLKTQYEICVFQVFLKKKYFAEIKEHKDISDVIYSASRFLDTIGVPNAAFMGYTDGYLIINSDNFVDPAIKGYKKNYSPVLTGYPKSIYNQLLKFSDQYSIVCYTYQDPKNAM